MKSTTAIVILNIVLISGVIFLCYGRKDLWPAWLLMFLFTDKKE